MENIYWLALHPINSVYNTIYNNLDKFTSLAVKERDTRSTPWLPCLTLIYKPFNNSPFYCFLEYLTQSWNALCTRLIFTMEGDLNTSITNRPYSQCATRSVHVFVLTKAWFLSWMFWNFLFTCIVRSLDWAIQIKWYCCCCKDQYIDLRLRLK